MEVVRERNTAFTCLVRACVAAALGALDNVPASRVAQREYAGDRTVEWMTRAPSLIADTIAAPALVQQVMPELLTTLAPVSAAAQLFSQGLRVNFGRAAEVAVPTILGDASYSAFVAEGHPIPVQQGRFEPLTVLTPKKLATIVVLTTEMVRSSNVEALMTDALVRSTGLALDNALFDDAPADAARPAGLRYGIAPLAPSTAPDPTAALMQDIETVCRAAILYSEKMPVVIMSRIRSVMAHLRSPHGLAPLTVVGSRALRGTMIMMALAPTHLVSAMGVTPEITAKRETALQMTTQPMDDAPVTRSLWQTDCVAVLVKLPVAWALRDASGVAWLQTTNW